MYGEDDNVVRLCSLMQQSQNSVECDVQWCDSADSTQRHLDGGAERTRQVTSQATVGRGGGDHEA
jgi:hypothetical protein